MWFSLLMRVLTILYSLAGTVSAGDDKTLLLVTQAVSGKLVVSHALPVLQGPVATHESERANVACLSM
jgi:hypothetical protein